eukprot:SM000012S25338  [mRNA]  locus=s12:460696:460941:- [translate_table: standard]
MTAATGASAEEMAAARLPLAARDSCAGLLIPLNACRQAAFYLPWRCEPERHAYEKCQYDAFMRRMKAMEAQRERESSSSRR